VVWSHFQEAMLHRMGNWIFILFAKKEYLKTLCLISFSYGELGGLFHNPDEVLKAQKLRDTYSIHYNQKLTHRESIHWNGSTLFELFASFNCPLTSKLAFESQGKF
jgi:hypothetical protein